MEGMCEIKQFIKYIFYIQKEGTYLSILYKDKADAKKGNYEFQVLDNSVSPLGKH